jgi:hypothetical protein
MPRRAALFFALAGLALAGPPKVGLRYAPSWDEAVEEARALNVPLVVHRHGFY